MLESSAGSRIVLPVRRTLVVVLGKGDVIGASVCLGPDLPAAGVDGLVEVRILDDDQGVLGVRSSQVDTTGQVHGGIWGSGEQALIEDVPADRRERGSAVCGYRGLGPFCADCAALEIGLGVAPK